MKTRNHFIVMAIVVIVTLALAIIGCKHDEPADTPKVQPDTPRTFTLGTTACTVTIKSDDQFTAAEWYTLCDKAVLAIERGYNAGFAGFPAVFGSAQNAKIVLGNNFTYNWEVKAGENRTTYIKTASINTVKFEDIVVCLNMNATGNG
jgi:hypothetical protein